jgi:hypothetical protein
MIETKFDNPKLSYESNYVVIFLNLFGAEDPKETGLLIGLIMDAYNELASNGPTIRELGKGIMAWVKDPHPERLKAIARAYLNAR